MVRGLLPSHHQEAPQGHPAGLLCCVEDPPRDDDRDCHEQFLLQGKLPIQRIVYFKQDDWCFEEIT